MFQQIQDGIDLSIVSRALQTKTACTVPEMNEISASWNRICKRLTPEVVAAPAAPPAPPAETLSTAP